jgi:hypothetical protein
MDDGLRWPKRGDNPFLIKAAEPNSPTWASLRWLSSLRVDDSLLAMAFKEAGDKIVRELARGEDSKHPDMLFMPIAYLYRHSLELKMKEIVRLSIELELLKTDEKLHDALGDHSLYPLWNLVRSAVEAYWPDEPKNDLNAAERIVQELHNIDKSGQNLRYSKDLSGRSTLEKLPDSVQLTHLQDVFHALFSLLDGCETGLDNAVEMRNEMLSDYGGDFS